MGTASAAPRVGRVRLVRANELDAGLLEAGTGPLALCSTACPTAPIPNGWSSMPSPCTRFSMGMAMPCSSGTTGC
jgi:hypothetical protein